jgi:hypothetical protein
VYTLDALRDGLGTAEAEAAEDADEAAPVEADRGRQDVE